VIKKIGRLFPTIVEHLAVIPQFSALFNDKGEPCFNESPEKLTWSAFPDFLAVDLTDFPLP